MVFDREDSRDRGEKISTMSLLVQQIKLTPTKSGRISAIINHFDFCLFPQKDELPFKERQRSSCSRCNAVTDCSQYAFQ